MLVRECDIKWLSSLEAAGSRGRVARHVHEKSGPQIQIKLTYGADGMGVGVERTELQGMLIEAPASKTPFRD